MSPNQRIYAADLADLLGKTERTVRRMFEQLEEKHGALVIRHDGRERYTTREQLERVGVLGVRQPEPAMPYDGKKLMAAFRRLMSDVAAVMARVDEFDERLTNLSVRVAHRPA